jgi:hypothetical protein
MKWFWVFLGRYFENRHKTTLPERKIHLTKAPKAFGDLNKEERREFIEKMAKGVLPKLSSEEYISDKHMGVSMSRARKSRFMFDLPVFSDWLFYLFIFFLLSNFYGSYQAVQQSGGVNTSTFSLISGSLDAAFGLLISWIMVAPVYWVRRFLRSKKGEPGA